MNQQTREHMQFMKVTITLIEGPASGRSFEFKDADAFLVGRSKKAHLRFRAEQDQFISRTHCLLDIRPPRCIITDLDSTNGSFVEETRIKERTEVEAGQLFRIGRTWLRVEPLTRFTPFHQFDDDNDLPF